MSRGEIVLIIALILLVVLIVITFKGRKTRKFKVTVADINYEVWRNRFDALEDEKDMKCFHKADGKKVWFSNHFTIMKEEIADVKETK